MRRPSFVALALLVIACQSDSPCVAAPCPLGLAIRLTVTSGTSSASVPGAFVHLPQISPDPQCTQSPGSTCLLPGVLGTYEIDVGAPGYQTVHRTVTVTGKRASACGCDVVDTQSLTVALSPS
jgi:hypothetical protein